ncbi:MAG: DUF1902 domain-containing protein [Phenylobacterium sp.]|uniref:DUF1902 domain-containing protein n=1 Tax=Phenylobacterium sp. TaxID=1871053 RepID=UPI0025E6BCB1|nr:DUF1902 domain-containing protein [Phenylobacterium sp.]MCA6247668.1 DUF1902 domain-containing protein [Phenylobacterium sp.]MCA6255349.1 DUF1902 domain-containing protein [Phenylobacterium sp.]
MHQSYYVKASWDPEASVWISETDIPGMVIEADTLAEFEAAMVELAPEMLAANQSLKNVRVSVDFTAQREFAVA